jgi:hypothetical protein
MLIAIILFSNTCFLKEICVFMYCVASKTIVQQVTRQHPLLLLLSDCSFRLLPGLLHCVCGDMVATASHTALLLSHSLR